ncbi:BRCA1-A complex subunit RAP80 isoform X2 [Protopterus annectens]|uniref:BRCA1-A complex subunit RAP80 isoform X2 n=1 Tax=Protopterus annectens TaxID=7888 RepID=UPI001CF962A3|nr:BRCA1-A complex subunit RAP80 isoform X2 [Protopterus annectens]
MPRKKRSCVEGDISQTEVDNKNEGKMVEIGKKKQFARTMCIVISDSEEERESTSENVVEKKKFKRERDRGKLLAKRRLAQMSEEEQLALAVQMSRQEACQINSKEEEEDELLRKAIAESLNSCQSSPPSTRKTSLIQKNSKSEALQVLHKSPVSAAVEKVGLASCSSSTQEDMDCHSQSLSQNSKSSGSGQSPSQKPCVVLAKLSQELPSFVEHSVSTPVKFPNQNQSICSGQSSLQSCSTFQAKLSQELFPSSPESCVVLPPTAFASPTLDQCLDVGSSPIQNPCVVLQKLSQEFLPSSSKSGSINVAASPIKEPSEDVIISVQSPRVVLEKLSMELHPGSPVKELSVSPVKKSSPFPEKNGSKDSVSTSPSKVSFSLSPSFLKKSPSSRQMKPRQLFLEQCKEKKISAHEEPASCSSERMIKVSQSHSLESPGHTFKLERKGRKRLQKSSSQSSECYASEEVVRVEENIASLSSYNTSDGKNLSADEVENCGAVHYRWGIPFCPKGLDPDQYTRVILCQFEVYEKSLKQAQRLLLSKAKMGEPVLPAPALSRLRRSDRGKADLLLDGEEKEAEVNDCDADKETEPIVENDVQTIECHISCEGDTLLESITPELNVNERDASESESRSHHQSLIVEETPVVEETPEVKKTSMRLLKVGSMGRRKSDSSTGSDISLEDQEDDILICPETQQSLEEVKEDKYEAVKDEKEELEEMIGEKMEEAVKKDEEVMVETEQEEEVKEEEQEEEVKEEEEKREIVTVVFPKETSANVAITDRCDNDDGNAVDITEGSNPMEECVECPLCGRNFPLAKIEVHAANCSDIGEQEYIEENSVVTRSYRGRKAEPVNANGLPPTETSKKCEKCYVCHFQVPVREYERHVDYCLLAANRDLKGIQRSRRSKRSAENDGRLLRVLEQSESQTTDFHPRRREWKLKLVAVRR